MEEGSLHERVAHWTRLIAYFLGRRVLAANARWSLRSGGFTALAIISENPGISQAELARDIGLDVSSVVAILNELEERKLVVRMRSRNDRRRNLLEVTEEGQKTIGAMIDATSVAEAPLRQEFSEAELAMFLEFLRRAHHCLMTDDLSPPTNKRDSARGSAPDKGS